jgi:DNA-binding IclR family transcriptional regulator
MSRWTFLTNHAHVFFCLARDPGARLREVAERVGITERAAQRILADLVAEGYVTAEKDGRRNHYSIHPDAPLRHPLELEQSVGKLLRLLEPQKPKAANTRGESTSR